MRRLLGLLVVADGGYVSADRIAEHLADGDVDGSKIRTAVSRLRKVLGDRIETVPGGYRLRLAEDEFDAARFESLRNRARVAAPPERIGLSVEALGLWNGDALEGVADEEWATPAAARLESARAVLTEDLADALCEVGRFDQAIELLDTHLVDHQYRERPVALLMRGLASAGRLLGSLADKSLLTVDNVHGVRRYRYLETIRSYAEDRFDETGDAAAAMRSLHDHHVQMMQTLVDDMRTHSIKPAADRLNLEIPNVRRTFEHALGIGDLDAAAQLIAPLSEVFGAIDRPMNGWASEALTLPDADSSAYLPHPSHHARHARASGVLRPPRREDGDWPARIDEARHHPSELVRDDGESPVARHADRGIRGLACCPCTHRIGRTSAGSSR